MNMQSGCWSIGEAEKQLRAYASNSTRLELAYTSHAEERMSEREIFGADVLHVFKSGHIRDEPEQTGRPGYCKYKICGKTLNSGNRTICFVVIPNPGKPAVKIVTAMWEDLR